MYGDGAQFRMHRARPKQKRSRFHRKPNAGAGSDPAEWHAREGVGARGCPGRRFRAWLVRISFRLALDRLRSAKRREQHDVLWSQPVYQPPAVTAEYLAASSEFQVHLDRALAELPGKLRLVLLLAAMEGHTIDEIAALLAIPVGTVKSRIFVARKQLAEKLRCHVNITKTR